LETESVASGCPNDCGASLSAQGLILLKRHLDKVEKDLHQTVRRSPVWREQDDLLQSVPGIGPQVSGVLLAELPELGKPQPRLA
jgi:hypothetical protein